MPHAAETLRSGCCRSGVVPSEGHRRDPLEMTLAKCNVNSCREGGKQAKSPLELALAQGAAEPGVIISQQCAGPLSALTAPDLQAAPRNAAADVLQMLHRHVAIICQQYKSPLCPLALRHTRGCVGSVGNAPPGAESCHPVSSPLERSNSPSLSPLNLVEDVTPVFFYNGCSPSLRSGFCAPVAQSSQDEGCFHDWSG